MLYASVYCLIRCVANDGGMCVDTSDNANIAINDADER